MKEKIRGYLPRQTGCGGSGYSETKIQEIMQKEDPANL
jgi:hypothetical protein